MVNNRKDDILCPYFLNEYELTRYNVHRGGWTYYMYTFHYVHNVYPYLKKMNLSKCLVLIVPVYVLGWLEFGCLCWNMQKHVLVTYCIIS